MPDLSFRKIGTTGTLASQAEIVSGLGTGGASVLSGARDITPGKFLILYMQNPAI